MDERSVPGGRGIDARAADELGMRRLDTVDGRQNDPRIVDGDPTVMVQVAHLPRTRVVDEDVGGVAIHVPAVFRPAPRIPASVVVLRRAKSAHHMHSMYVDAVRL